MDRQTDRTIAVAHVQLFREVEQMLSQVAQISSIAMTIQHCPLGTAV
jgi:hypothetical protein